MWLHPAENSHFGARHLQVDPKFVEDFQIASSIQSLVEENVLLNLSESGKEVSTCFSCSKVCSHICMFKI